MSNVAPLRTLAVKGKPLNNSVHAGLLLQRKSAVGSPSTSLIDERAECKSGKRLQTKLTIGASNDPLEQEADRVADQVLAAPAHSAISGATPHIQRFAGQASRQADMVPDSVDSVLASSGKPLEPTLQKDMEQRFGHDFSRVRVHSGREAAQSAQDVNAHAYTVGHNVVFNSGRFAPETREGRHLIAHELTHVVQQSGTAAPGGANRTAVKADRAGISATQPAPKVLLRQPAPRGAKGDAPKATVPAAAPAMLFPTFQATAAADWIRDPQDTKTELFGLTQLSTSGTRPELRVGPASSGKGFVVLPTGTSLAKPITLQYLQPGRYPEHAIRLRLQEGGLPGGYLRLWEITADGSEAIKAGEQEHCDDFRLAYYLSFYRYAELVNEVAVQGTVFPTEAAAKAALKGKVFIEATHLPDYFKCLADEMRDRRDKAGWHTPRKSDPALGYDSKLRDDVAVRTLSARSLPDVGKHSSGELLFQHAAPACLRHTTLPTVTP
jgi:Domain of unknown function (DUF4157)